MNSKQASKQQELKEQNEKTKNKEAHNKPNDFQISQKLLHFPELHPKIIKRRRDSPEDPRAAKIKKHMPPLPHKTFKKLLKRSWRSTQKPTLGALVSSRSLSYFSSIFNAKCTEQSTDIIGTMNISRGDAENAKLRFGCTSANRSRVGPSRAPQKQMQCAFKTTPFGSC